ncbi:alpha/beta fold hydrolase [Nocardioides sp. BP30]|uniref:alpha/beta fold hydrolase n=1 Tax=Nocardioides sp. BP30 TaxID=3036374 RepID=UPI002468F17F|nr:alpha/beta fold hydrolase [Nocardioides sp. BP30]WGL51846.1 alpha/beta fold hydrolase [Nocardioides sp. BP30]
MTERITQYERDGLVFDVADTGPLDGPVVVLLHGFPERNTCWRDVAPLLHAQGLRTLAPDQRGYSPGARPPRRRDYVLPELSRDVAALIEAVRGQGGDVPIHLVGHDWGAMVGWHLAAKRPELVASYTAFSVPHPAAFVHALRGRQALKSWYMAAFNVPLLPEWLGETGRMRRMLRGAGMTRADVARFQTEIVEYGALPGGLGYYRALPFSLGGLRDDLTVRVPTTMVWSDGDTALDRKGPEETAEYCTGPYEFVELVGVSHWIPTHAPQEAAEAILGRIGDA